MPAKSPANVRPEQLATGADIAELLDVPEQTLAQWRYLGKGPGCQNRQACPLRLGGREALARHAQDHRGGRLRWRVLKKQSPGSVSPGFTHASA